MRKTYYIWYLTSLLYYLLGLTKGITTLNRTTGLFNIPILIRPRKAWFFRLFLIVPQLKNWISCIQKSEILKQKSGSYQFWTPLSESASAYFWLLEPYSSIIMRLPRLRKRLDNLVHMQKGRDQNRGLVKLAKPVAPQRVLEIVVS